MTLSPERIRRAFGAAAERYDAHAELQRTVAARCAEYARGVFTEGMHIADIGTGTGYIPRALGDMRMQVVAIDSAFSMCAQAKRSAAQPVCADMAALPLRDACMDGIVSSLALQWAIYPQAVLKELARVTVAGGHAVVATLGPQTLGEMAASFSAVDGNPRINAFPALPVLLGMAEASGWSVEMAVQERVVQYHADFPALLRSLKAIGAQQHASARRGLTAPSLFLAAEAHYRAAFGRERGIPATWQVYYLHFKRAGA